MQNLQAEEKFYSSKFHFSYSGLNKLLFSPALFYKHYILDQREERTDAHLVEGKLLHCLLLDENSFDKQFVLSPTSIPTGGAKTIIDGLFRLVCEQNKLDKSFEDLEFEILQLMQEQNFYQKLKTDSQRIEKICTDDAIAYFEFLKSKSGKDIVDRDTYLRIQEDLNTIRNNKNAMTALGDLEKQLIYSELLLTVDLPSDYPFGLKGIIDRVIVDGDTVRIVDLKTSGKTIAEFKDTVEYYNYWLQAAIYVEMISKKFQNVKKIEFTFVVIDKYKQIYCFEVSPDTLSTWKSKLYDNLNQAKYHYSNRSYSLPYEFLTSKIVL